MRYLSSLLALSLLIPCVGQAETRQLGGENVTYGYAQVLSSSPVYETVPTVMTEQRCDGPPGNGRCRAVQVAHQERRLAGYDVEYQYKGERYMSRLDSDPGNRLRIRVAITPEPTPTGYR
jgi:uncharacterized protein YcfJ